MEGTDAVSGCWPVVTDPTPVSERAVYPGEGLVLKELTVYKKEI